MSYGWLALAGIKRVEAVLDPVPRVGGRAFGDGLAVRRGEEIDEVARREQRLDIVLERIVGDAGLGRVRHRAAQRFLRHHLVGHRLHHVGAGDEHVARILHHEDEVGHRRRIDRAARARAHDQADLRHHARREHVALEHLGIAAEARDALLNPRAARIVEPDHRRADLHRQVHHLADLLRVAFGQRPAEHGEVLAEHAHQPAVDRARAGDHAVAGDDLVLHPEIDAIMLDEHVELLEAALRRAARRAVRARSACPWRVARRCAFRRRPGGRLRGGGRVPRWSMTWAALFGLFEDERNSRAWRPLATHWHDRRHRSATGRSQIAPRPDVSGRKGVRTMKKLTILLAGLGMAAATVPPSRARRRGPAFRSARPI